MAAEVTVLFCGEPGAVCHTAVGVEAVAVCGAPGGKGVWVDMGAPDFSALPLLVRLDLLRALEPILEGLRKGVLVDHEGPAAVVRFRRVPGDANGFDFHGSKGTPIDLLSQGAPCAS